MNPKRTAPAAWQIIASLGLAVSAAADPASRVLQEPTVRSNVLSPPFEGWGPAAQEVFLREQTHSSYPAEIHYDLGLYFYDKGMYELSLQHYRKAVEIDPKFAEAHFGMGLLFYTLGDDENAIKHYRRSLEHDAYDPDTRNNLGLIYYRRGELEKAEAEITEALKLRPAFADACYNLGLIRYRQRDLEGAVGLFLKALAQDPDYHRARFNLGVAYFELGKGTLAEEQWARILEAAPGSTIAEQAQENLTILKADDKN